MLNISSNLLFIVVVSAFNIFKSAFIVTISSSILSNTDSILFILLVFSKVNRNSGRTDDYWIFKDSTLLFSLAKYKYNRNENRNSQRNYLINDFDNIGLISQSVKINSEGI